MKNTYTHITTAATNTIFTGTGQLAYLNVNKATTGTITIADGSTTVAVIAASTPAQSFIFNTVAVGTSLVVTNSATEDITVVWSR